MVHLITREMARTELVDELNGFNIWPRVINIQSLELCLVDKNNLLLIDCENGQLRGYAFGYLLCKLASLTAVLDSLEVLNQYRGLGIGRELMQKFFLHSRNVWNADNVSLLVNPENQVAINLYDHFDADQFGYMFSGKYLLTYFNWQINE